MKRKWQLSRRAFLRGLGVTLALPTLEAMDPPLRLLAETGPRPASPPLRMAFVYVPNGKNMADWTPTTSGPDYELPSTLQPLADVKSDFQVISGLCHQKAFANGDGAGDHARASATFLTGCQARKTAGADIRAGMSVDQVAAQKLGRATRLPSLELSCDKGVEAGSCDSGYACAYQFHISWRAESVPNAVENDPRQVFERLFGGGTPGETAESRLRRERDRQSILDYVREDAKKLQKNLGATDRRKLDEYLAAVRDLELRLDSQHTAAANIPDKDFRGERPRDYQQHLRLMADLLVLAFQTDTTRIATFMFAHDGSNRPYPFIGVPEGHHDISHHEEKAEKKARIAKINRFHVEQFAYLLRQLKAIKEGQGTLLDNCMIVYGSGIADGNSHNHNNLPVLLAGGGAGTLTPGRHLQLATPVPMTNLYLSMLQRMGTPVDRLGDSTGLLREV